MLVGILVYKAMFAKFELWSRLPSLLVLMIEEPYRKPRYSGMQGYDQNPL